MREKTVMVKIKQILFSSLVLITISCIAPVDAQTYLTADIQKQFYTSIRLNSSISSVFFTNSIFGSYSYKDYVQFFVETGYIRFDMGYQLDQANGIFLSVGAKNKYYHDHESGIPLDLAWYLQVKTHFFAEKYQSEEIDFRLMSLHLGHIFSKHLGQFEPYNSYGLVYSLNDYDGPSTANHLIPNNFDLYINAGVRWNPISHLAFMGEVFIFQKPGVGAAVEIIF